MKTLSKYIAEKLIVNKNYKEATSFDSIAVDFENKNVEEIQLLSIYMHWSFDKYTGKNGKWSTGLSIRTNRVRNLSIDNDKFKISYDWDGGSYNGPIKSGDNNAFLYDYDLRSGTTHNLEIIFNPSHFTTDALNEIIKLFNKNEDKFNEWAKFKLNGVDLFNMFNINIPSEIDTNSWKDFDFDVRIYTNESKELKNYIKQYS